MNNLLETKFIGRCARHGIPSKVANILLEIYRDNDYFDDSSVLERGKFLLKGKFLKFCKESGAQLQGLEIDEIKEKWNTCRLKWSMQFGWMYNGLFSESTPTTDPVFQGIREFYATLHTQSETDMFRAYIRGVLVIDENLIDNYKSYVKIIKLDPQAFFHWTDAVRIAVKKNVSIARAEEISSDRLKRDRMDRNSFISRYGEKEGSRRYDEFVRKSSDWMKTAKERFGDDFFTRRSWCCEDFYRDSGMTAPEIKKAISDAQHARAGVFRSYWERVGLTPSEIDDKFKIMNPKKGLNDRNLSHSVQKYGEAEGIRHNRMTIDRELESKESLTRFGDMYSYRASVRYFTRVSVKLHLDLIENGNLYKKPGYSIDHMFSQKSGYLNQIPPSVIGAHYNLRIIPKGENALKRDGCCISLEELSNRANKSYENS